MLPEANASASTGLTAYEPLHAYEQTENIEHGFGSEFSLKWAHLNMRSEEIPDMFPQTRNALTKRHKQTYMFVKLTRKPSYGQHPIPYKQELTDEDLRPATCSRPGMAKHTATPRTLPPRKNLSLAERVPSSGIRCVPKGEVNAPGKHSNCALSGQQYK